MRCYFNLYEVYSLLVNRKLLIMYIPIFKERAESCNLTVFLLRK